MDLRLPRSALKKHLMHWGRARRSGGIHRRNMRRLRRSESNLMKSTSNCLKG
jgi:hypothetical protein